MFVQDSNGEYSRYESWYSDDGAIWRQANASLPFSVSSSHSLTSYAGRMWIVDGSAGVWSSADGTIWDRKGEIPPGVSWKDPVVLVYDDKLWAIGGDRSEWRDDAWSSSDGITWTRAGDSIATLAMHGMGREHRYGYSVSVMCGPQRVSVSQ